MAPCISFRPFSAADGATCLAMFDANCPRFFAPSERRDYESFLDSDPDGYEICEAEGQIVGAFGLSVADGSRATLCWILIDPRYQGAGTGTAMMRRAILLGRASRSSVMAIATSQKSAAFFARFGAVTKKVTRDGWGAGLDRLDMELAL